MNTFLSVKEYFAGNESNGVLVSAALGVKELVDSRWRNHMTNIFTGVLN